MMWRDVPGFEGKYRISDHGKVLSVARVAARSGRTVPSRILKTEVNPRDGHHRVTLYGDRGKRRLLVHRIVLQAFVSEPPPDKPVGRHLNGNPDDNSLMNLEWSTHSQNALDKLAHGTCFMRNRTRCHMGHVYEGENLRWATKNGRRFRVCRTCTAARNRRQYERRTRLTGKARIA